MSYLVKSGKEDVPHDWKVGQLVKLPTNDDLNICVNHIGIMLLSAPGKVLNRIMLKRI